MCDYRQLRRAERIRRAFEATWDDWAARVLATDDEPRFYYEGLVLHG